MSSPTFAIAPAGAPLPGPGGAICTLTDVKLALNIDATVDAGRDAQLQDFIQSASEECDYWCGPTIPQVITESFRTAGDSVGVYAGTFWPGTQPVLSVTTLTDTYTGQTSGMALQSDGSILVQSLSSIGPMTLVYVAGRPSVPYGIKRGVIDLVRVMWEQEQRGGRPGYGQQEDGGGFFVPSASGKTLLPDSTRRHWARYMRKDGFS